MSEIGWFEIEGVRLRSEPARDDCFRVVLRDKEMEEYDLDDPRAPREAVHRHMSNEITSLDIAAQCVADFPSAPWDLRMELARQCWDEARHIEALHRRLVEMGGHKGEFPISTFEWSITAAIDNLAGRLASQNRTFEAGAMDVVGESLPIWRDQIGDEATASVLDAILADEIQHVRFANRWIRKLVAADRVVLMKVAMAVRFVAQVNTLLQPKDGEKNAAGKSLDGFARARLPVVNIEDRRLAEFSDEEIHEILKQAGFRSLAADTLKGTEA
jgi:uncharacterized ferritin-like protein (DUF455 family)